MRIPERDTAVFSTSAIDLFASALGAFILLVMLLFPYYQNAGTDQAFAQTEAIMEQRRLAAGQTEEMMSTADELQSELERLERSNEGIEEDISLKREQLASLERQIASIPVPDPSPIPNLSRNPLPLNTALNSQSWAWPRRHGHLSS